MLLLILILPETEDDGAQQVTARCAQSYHCASHGVLVEVISINWNSRFFTGTAGFKGHER